MCRVSPGIFFFVPENNVNLQSIKMICINTFYAGAAILGNIRLFSIGCGPGKMPVADVQASPSAWRTTGILTPASFWPMLAEIPSEAQARRMTEFALRPDKLGGEVPWVTVSRDDPDFDANDGCYWRGSMWLPISSTTRQPPQLPFAATRPTASSSTASPTASGPE